MPIKFRCQHCRQFLGISRERAGDVFDCPTCGRSLRVPELDGTVKPLPKPSLDLGDSLLRRALDELADLDQSGGDAVEFQAQPFEGMSSQDRSAAGDPSTAGELASIEPISVVPQAAPKPIELPPVVPIRRVVVAEPEHVASRSTRQADEAWKAAIELAEGDSADSPQIEPDPEKPPKPAVHTTISTRSARQVELNASFWFAVVGVAASVFTAGFWTGRLTVPAAVAVNHPVPPPNPDDNSKREDLKPAVASSVPGIRGRITYRPENGANKPDKSARIIALPVDWNGKTKLQVAGFRAGDSPEDQRVARASLQAMGGDIAITDDSGEFNISLKSGGKYLLIVLSGSMPRAESDDVTTKTQQLGAYFDRPNQLVGKVMVHLEPITWNGDGAQPWDHVFQHSS